MTSGDRAQRRPYLIDASAAGPLRATTGAAGLSLGDRACLALADAMDGTAVTADRSLGALDLATSVLVVR